MREQALNLKTSGVSQIQNGSRVWVEDREGAHSVSILVVLSCISSSEWKMTSVTFLLVGRYRSAWKEKELMWHSADFLHGASFEVCGWGSCWFFLAGQRPATPAESRILKVGSSVPAPFMVETWGGTSNTHAPPEL